MKAVLYSLWNKTLFKASGEVEDMNPKIPGAYDGRRYKNFYISLRNGHKDRRTVSMLEGYVYNKSLWLTKENDEFAKAAFIEYEQSRIQDLERQIEVHKELIEILETNPPAKSQTMSMKWS